MKTLGNKVVALTGAASGIGRELALALASMGSHLALSDVDMEGLLAVQEECEAIGHPVHVALVDVSDKKEVEEWAGEVNEHYGQVHVLINNAGIAAHGTIEELPDEIFEQVMSVNFWGVVHGTRAFLPFLKRASQAHIVNLSSLFGLVGIPGQGAYNASKFAVRGFSEALTQELELLSPHVKCSCVHPGGVKTNIARAARFVGQQLGRTDPDKLARRFDKVASTTAEDAAQQIIAGLLADKRRILVGKDAQMLDALQRFIPSHYHDIVMRPYKKGLQRAKRSK